VSEGDHHALPAPASPIPDRAAIVKRIVVRYRVKPERVAENERLIGAVFEALQHERPAGLRYASFKAQDGVSFLHLVSIETSDGSNPLGAVPAFKAFTAAIGERCDDPPVATELVEVGSYRFFAA
jgi:hypothetical protein